MFCSAAGLYADRMPKIVQGGLGGGGVGGGLKWRANEGFCRNVNYLPILAHRALHGGQIKESLSGLSLFSSLTHRLVALHHGYCYTSG